MTSCVFCERSRLEQRVFYDEGSWYALLAAPPFTRGQTILALKNSAEDCPASLTIQHLKGLDIAIASVIDVLHRHFRPKDVLIASLRGRDPHIHFHLMPLWEVEEQEWRQQSHRERGHLFEYLGWVETKAKLRVERERAEYGWSEERHRAESAKQLQTDVDALRELTFYGRPNNSLERTGDSAS